MKNRADARNQELLEACKAGNTEEVRRLIEAGVDVNIQDSNKWVPLHEVALYGHAEVCDTLIKAGAGVNTRNSWKRTSLHYAAERGYTEICHILLRAGADVKLKDNYGKTPRKYVDNNDHELAKILELYELNPELARVIYA